MVKLFILGLIAVFTTSIYSFSVSDINGGTVNFSAFEGKKILIVNTASTSEFTAQLGGLEQLYQKYKDSLVVIAFPSNSFGSDPRSNQEIKNFMMDYYHAHFLIASKVEVVGPEAVPLYQWLTKQSENGMMNTEIKSDFQKYLIDKDGTLVGVFASTVDPMNAAIQNAITGN